MRSLVFTALLLIHQWKNFENRWSCEVTILLADFYGPPCTFDHGF